MKLIHMEHGREGKGRWVLTGKLPKLAGDIYPGNGRRERGQKGGREARREEERKKELFQCPCGQYTQTPIQGSGRSQARVTGLPVRCSER